MIQLSLTYDDLRKVGAALRRPDVALTACGPAPGGAIKVTVLADVAKLADITNLVSSLKVSITLELIPQALGDGRIQLTLSDLTLDKSQAPLLARPFLRPNTFKKVLFDQLANRDDLVADPDAGTIVADLNTLEQLKKLGMAATVHTLEVNDDGIVIGLTLADRTLD